MIEATIIATTGRKPSVDFTPEIRESWMDAALCAQTDPEIFFPEKGGSVMAAKAVCARCPVAEQCLSYAIRNGLRDGIWGGKSPRERAGHVAGVGGRPMNQVIRESIRGLHAKGMNDVQISVHLGCAVSAVNKIRRELGLPSMRQLSIGRRKNS